MTEILEILERTEYIWYIIIYILGVAYLTVAERKTMGIYAKKIRT